MNRKRKFVFYQQPGNIYSVHKGREIWATGLKLTHDQFISMKSNLLEKYERGASDIEMRLVLDEYREISEKNKHPRDDTGHKETFNQGPAGQEFSAQKTKHGAFKEGRTKSGIPYTLGLN